MTQKISIHIPEKMKKSNPDYAEFMAKFWMCVAAVLIGINTFFVLTLMQMTPRLKIVAQVLTEPMNSLQLIQAEPFDSGIADRNLIEEMLVRYYLTERYTLFPDEREMSIRWSGRGEIARLSAPQVYYEFYAGLGEMANSIQKLNYTQGIDIRTISRRNDTWTVEFDVYQQGSGFSRKETRVAVLETREIPSRRIYRTRMSNPYGFTVIKYRDAEKKQSFS